MIENNTKNHQNPIDTNSLPKCYSPIEYTFVGFFLSILPVLIMSWSNSFVFPNGEKIRGFLKWIILIFIGIIIAFFAIIGWASYSVGSSMMSLIASDMTAFSEIMRGSFPSGLESDQSVNLAVTIVQYSSYIFGVLNLALLVFTIRFLNKEELPVYKEMIENKKIQGRAIIIPALIGIVFVLGIYFGTTPYIEMMMRLAF